MPIFERSRSQRFSIFNPASVVVLIGLLISTIVRGGAATTAPVDNVLRDELTTVIGEMQDKKMATQGQATQWAADAEHLLSIKISESVKQMRGDQTEAGDQAFIGRSKQIFSDWKAVPPDVIAYLIKQNKVKKLTGDRLKLAAQLTVGELERLVTPRV